MKARLMKLATLWGVTEMYEPFLLQGYVDVATYCDRGKELVFLKKAMTNLAERECLTVLLEKEIVH